MIISTLQVIGFSFVSFVQLNPNWELRNPGLRGAMEAPARGPQLGRAGRIPEPRPVELYSQTLVFSPGFMCMREVVCSP